MPPPVPCPVAFPNFSMMPRNLPTSIQVNMLAAQARGFTAAGADEMYAQSRAPSGAGDRIILSRFAINAPMALVELNSPPPAPRQARVLIDTDSPAADYPRGADSLHIRKAHSDQT